MLESILSGLVVEATKETLKALYAKIKNPELKKEIEAFEQDNKDELQFFANCAIVIALPQHKFSRDIYNNYLSLSSQARAKIIESLGISLNTIDFEAIDVEVLYKQYLDWSESHITFLKQYDAIECALFEYPQQRLKDIIEPVSCVERRVGFINPATLSLATDIKWGFLSSMDMYEFVYDQMFFMNARNGDFNNLLDDEDRLFKRKASFWTLLSLVSDESNLQANYEDALENCETLEDMVLTVALKLLLTQGGTL